MSLAITLYNHHGIVMCADKLVVSYINNIKIHQSFTEQKLFLVHGKYGLSYTGIASIGDIPVSALIESYIFQNKLGNDSPIKWFEKLIQYFHNNLSETQNIIFIFSGSFKDEKFVATSNTMSPDIKIEKRSSGILYSGENAFVSHIIKSKLITFDFAKFTIEDSKKFLEFLISTVSGIMNFGQYFPTVSSECDSLIIRQDNVYFLKS